MHSPRVEFIDKEAEWLSSPDPKRQKIGSKLCILHFRMTLKIAD
jgi:hypothetical protein